MSDSIYGPAGPVSGGPNLIDAGRAGATPAAPARSPAPAPDTAPKTLAGIFYGTDGPKNEPGGPRGISDGVAKPAAQPESQGGDHLSATQTDQPAPSAFDPAKLTLPEGVQADPALMGEFATTAKALGLNHTNASQLVQLHQKAMAAQAEQHNKTTEGWANETRQHYGNELTQVAATIRDAIGTDHDGQEFMRLMDWSGLGNNAAVLRVLQRLARGY